MLRWWGPTPLPGDHDRKAQARHQMNENDEKESRWHKEDISDTGIHILELLLNAVGIALKIVAGN